MNTRHSNMLAMAHFLKTTTEPVLVGFRSSKTDYRSWSQLTTSVQYYKPWQLRRGDEEIITRHIEEAESIVTREAAEFDARYPPEPEEQKPADQSDREDHGRARLDQGPREANGPATDTTDTVGSEIDRDRGTEIPRTNPTTSANDHAQPTTAPAEASRGHDDDGGEVVEEDKEDTVIY
jgi:hypothetical protein